MVDSLGIEVEGGSGESATTLREYATLRDYASATIRGVYRAWETDPNRHGIADPRVRQALAQLRREVNAEPGSSPVVWEYLPGDPAACIRAEFGSASFGGGATAQEIAVHHALTLWAFHQQSKSEFMHDERRGDDGSSVSRSLAQAVRELSRRRDPLQEDGSKGPTLSRFVAALRAQTIGALALQLRGLIQMLREEGIAFDYGRLAQDLLWLQFPSTRARVQRQWSRDLYRAAADAQQNRFETDSDHNDAKEA